MFRFDQTQRSVVVICTRCGARDVFTDRSVAESWAAVHLRDAHPDPSRERMAALTASRVRQHRR